MELFDSRYRISEERVRMREFIPIGHVAEIIPQMKLQPVAKLVETFYILRYLAACP